MRSHIGRAIRVACFAVIWGSTWIVPAFAELSPPLASREIIATGDEIRDFGRVGNPSISVGGIDGQGRVLFGAQLTDGRLGLFLGDGSGTETVWASSEDGPRLQIHSARISESGRIFAPAFAGCVFYSLPTDLFEVRKDGLHRLVGPGDLTEEGDVICQIGDFAMNETGAIAMHTGAAPSLDGCGTFEAGFTAIYLIADGLPRRLLRADFSDFVAPIGMTGDGFALVANYSEDTIMATDGVVTRPLVDDDPLMSPSSAVGNTAGQVAFIAYDELGPRRRLFLSTDGAVRELASTLDRTPAGDPITSFDELKIDGAGNVVVSVRWSTSGDANGPSDYGVIRYSPDGEATLIGRGIYQPEVNGAGHITALQRTTTDPPDVVRWTDQEQRLIVDGSSRAPGGGRYAAGGVSGGCMSEEGLVGLFASSTESGEGLLCADGAGVHPFGADELSQRFNFFLECQFSQDNLLFTASEGDLGGRDYGESTLGVYRAEPGGITRLIGPGDAVIDGGHLDRLRDAGNRYFATNDSGSIVVAALTDVGERLLLLRQGRILEALPIAATDLSLGATLYLGIATDDTVIAIIDPPGDETVWEGDDDDDAAWCDDDDAGGCEDEDDAGRNDDAAPTTLVAVGSTGLRVLARTGDATLPGGPYRSFSGLWVRDNIAWFTAVDREDSRHALQYDLIESTIRDIELPGLEEDYFVILSISPSGRILYETGTYQPTLSATRRLVGADGSVELLSDGRQAFDPEPVALNDRGHVLLNTRQSPLGAQRVTLSLAGPKVTAICPSSTPTSAHEDDGCQIVAPTSSSISWPVLLIAFLAAAGRMIRRLAR